MFTRLPFFRSKIPAESTSMRIDSIREKLGPIRILIIGRANSGKTTILKQICNSTKNPAIYGRDGNKVDPRVIGESRDRGIHDIESGLVFRSNPNFIFHDSSGFEAGSIEEFQRMKDFVSERAKSLSLKEHIHAIWYCIPMGQYHRAISGHEEKFFDECDAGPVPVILVLTQCDALLIHGLAALTPDEKRLPFEEKVVKGQQIVESMLRENCIWDKLQRMKYPPKASVELWDMHKSDEGCKLLIEETVKTLDEETIQMLTQHTNTMCTEWAMDSERLLRKAVISQFPHLESVKLCEFFQTCYEVQSRKLENSCNAKIASLENTIQELRSELAGSRADIDCLVRVHEQKHQCETLYTQGHINDAAQLLLEILDGTNLNDAVKANRVIASWLPEFTRKCITILEEKGDKATGINNTNEALVAYTTALSLGPSIPNCLLLSKWAKSVVHHDRSLDEAMKDAAALKLPAFNVHQAICDALEGDGRIMEAVECLRQMQQKLSGDVRTYDEHAHQQWTLNFQRRCRDSLEKLGEASMESHRYQKAAIHFSMVLSLDPPDRIEILVKRSKARVCTGSWKDALCDANEIVKLDPSSHRGYERRHAALHAGNQYKEAVDAFHAMLEKLDKSPHSHIREIHSQYLEVTPLIQKAIEKTVSDMPRVLIDTDTGYLCDKERQMAAFKELSIYDELRSSMTTPLLVDYPRIMREVKQFYRYVMLSHRWEKYGEPCYQTLAVQKIPINKLPASSPNNKLQDFCKVSRALKFHWAWSDTCCIDKSNLVVLHESLVAMFTWYRGSALTLVYLHDVSSQLQKRNALRDSEWNKRGWTYQEYVAAETVQFYTKDWKPYLGLDVFNHKKSPIIVEEMEQASQVSAMALAALQPGLDRAQEKLFLAGQRQTTLAEDTAYSLLGIFNAAIPIRYGEGKCMAIGRLLEHVLAGSGDVTILAWTGPAGEYNSCLPPDLTVYDQLVPPHIPRPVDPTDMADTVTTLQSSLSESDLTSVVQFYVRLNGLPLPSLNSSLLQLPGLAFPIRLRLAESNSENNLRLYRGTTPALGEVEVRTTDNLSGVNRLLLFHAWISTLLDQDFSDNDGSSLWLDDSTRALRLVARLRQPFGALLLTQVSRVQYRRIATDSLIMTQIREEMLVTDLMRSITTVIIQ